MHAICLDSSAPDSCFQSVAFFDSSDSSRSRSEPVRGETLQHDVEKSRRIERKRRRARSWPDAAPIKSKVHLDHLDYA